MLLNGSFTVLAFSGVLWSISPLLFVVAVGYAAVGSVLTIVLGRPLVWLNYDQLDNEADFRADLIHVRENAESVAFLHARTASACGWSPHRRAGRQPQAHHRRQSQPRLLHHRLQLS